MCFLVDGDQKSKKLESELQTDTEAPEPISVGRYLKDRREAQDRTLRDAASMLRIHRNYISAIEENEIEKLPGPTYAIGFVRAYAEFLGLDGAAVVTRFKEEGKVLNKRTQLVFPAPVPEGQIPSLGVLLLAGVLVLVAYGAWLFVTSPENRIANLIPSLPRQFDVFVQNDQSASSKTTVGGIQNQTRTIKDKTGSAGPSLVEEGSAIPSNLKTLTAKDNGTLASVSGPSKYSDKTASGKGVDSVGISRKETLNLKSLEVNSNENRSGNGTPVVVGIPQLKKKAEKFVDQRNGDGSVLSVVTQAVGDAALDIGYVPLSVSAIQSVPKVLEKNTPRILGDPEVKSRIKIVLIYDSWVQIKDDIGEIILTQVLRKGDLYRVPDRSGLILETGNAGALQFFVDGELVPEVGPLGSVRRNVNLDPDALRGGTAYVRQ